MSLSRLWVCMCVCVCVCVCVSYHWLSDHWCSHLTVWMWHRTSFISLYVPLCVCVHILSLSVMSDPLCPMHCSPPGSPPCPWRFPGKNAVSVSKGSSWPSDWTRLLNWQVGSLPLYHLGSSISLCCCLIAKSCPILRKPTNGNTPGFPVLHYLLEFAQTLVHWVSDAIQPSHTLFPSSPPALSLSQNWFFVLGVQSIGASA